LELSEIQKGPEEEEEPTIGTPRSRKLQIFFGQRFDVDEVTFCERLRSPAIIEGEEPLPPLPTELEEQPFVQPSNIKVQRLKKFFGERISVQVVEPPASDEGDKQLQERPSNLKRNDSILKVRKMLGKRIDELDLIDSTNQVRRFTRSDSLKNPDNDRKRRSRSFDSALLNEAFKSVESSPSQSLVQASL